MVFGYLKASRNHLLGGTGMFFVVDVVVVVFLYVFVECFLWYISYSWVVVSSCFHVVFIHETYCNIQYSIILRLCFCCMSSDQWIDLCWSSLTLFASPFEGRIQQISNMDALEGHVTTERQPNDHSAIEHRAIAQKYRVPKQYFIKSLVLVKIGKLNT